MNVTLTIVFKWKWEWVLLYNVPNVISKYDYPLFEMSAGQKKFTLSGSSVFNYA